MVKQGYQDLLFDIYIINYMKDVREGENQTRRMKKDIIIEELGAKTT